MSLLRALLVILPLLVSIAQATERCREGEIISGRYIVRHAPLPFVYSAATRGKMRESVVTKMKARSIATLENTEIEVISTQESSATIPEALGRGLKEGELLSVEHDRIVCPFQSPTFQIKGRARYSNSLPPFPRAITRSGSNILTINNNGSVTEASLVLEHSGMKRITEAAPVRFWDQNDDGIPDLLTNNDHLLITPFGNLTPETADFFPGNKLWGLSAMDSTSFPSSVDKIDAHASQDTDGDGKKELLYSYETSLYLLKDGVSTLIHDFKESIAALGDLEGDGDIDVITNQRIDVWDESWVEDTYRIYRNTGALTFSLANTFQRFDGDSEFTRITGRLLDIDLDGDGDIVAHMSNRDAHHILIHRQQSDGTFVSSMLQPFEKGVRLRPEGIEIADMDRDGYPEILALPWLADCTLGQLTLYKNVAGNFTTPLTVPYSRCLTGATLADYNGDGAADIVATDKLGYISLLRQEPTSPLSFKQIDLVATGDSYRGFNYAQDVILHDPLALLGTIVELVNETGVVRAQEVDEFGEYTFKNVPPGRYTVRARRNGYLVYSERGDSLSIDKDMEEVNFHGISTSNYTPADYTPPAGAPDEQSFGALWGLDNRGQMGGVSGVDIKALDAWRTTRGDAHQIVAVLDDGIDYSHPDLFANMWANKGEIAANGKDDDNNGVVDDIFGYDSVDDDGNPMPEEEHGTHVAGTIAAIGGNGLGVVGVAPQSKLMALRVLGKGGSSVSVILKGLDYAVKMKDRGVNIRVVNASLGAPSECLQATLNVLEQLNKRGVVFVAAAGNGGEDSKGDNNDVTPNTPGSCKVDNVVQVGNIKADGELVSSSNYGVESVHVAAPGGEILSTTPNGFYDSLTGTSMASPHVAGVASLILSVNPNLTPVEVRSLLMRSVSPMAHLKGKIASGGVVDAAKAVAMAKPPTPSPVSPTPRPHETAVPRPQETATPMPQETLAPQEPNTPQTPVPTIASTANPSTSRVPQLKVVNAKLSPRTISAKGGKVKVRLLVENPDATVWASAQLKQGAIKASAPLSLLSKNGTLGVLGGDLRVRFPRWMRKIPSRLTPIATIRDRNGSTLAVTLGVITVKKGR